jgi:hypothetical protein
MRMLADLPDKRFPIRIRHPIPGFDLHLIFKLPVKYTFKMLHGFIIWKYTRKVI